MTDQPAAEYSPEAIRWWHSGRCPRCRWAMLESAVEGGTGASGLGSGRGERHGLIHLKADLEHAADQLPLHFQTTAWIFSRQHRFSVLKARRTAHPFDEASGEQPSEHPIPSTALEMAFYAMSRSLGYQEPLTGAA